MLPPRLTLLPALHADRGHEGVVGAFRPEPANAGGRGDWVQAPRVVVFNRGEASGAGGRAARSAATGPAAAGGGRRTAAARPAAVPAVPAGADQPRRARLQR